MNNLETIAENQHALFRSGATRDISYRRDALIALRDELKNREQDFFDALNADLGRPDMESLTGETNLLRTELSLAIKNLGNWTKTFRVPTGLALQPGRSEVTPRPFGRVLIIAPWNYPLQLAVGPMISAIAAGNCVTVKPSELTPATGKLLSEVVSQTLSPGHVEVVLGGSKEGAELLNQKFDFIFFTGSKGVGHKVAQAAAEQLTPLVLELGGKSPCIVDTSADLEVSARRLIWGKCYNGGQSCVAPDYALVHRDVNDQFLALMKKSLDEFFGEDPCHNPDLTGIVDERNFTRLKDLQKNATIYCGGGHDAETRRIEPTILTNVSLDDTVMGQEIFGPILPVVPWTNEKDIAEIVSRNPDPLAMYVFTKRRAFGDRIFSSIPAGGGCINDVLVHFINSNLPLGGIGSSGMGKAHGKWGFDTFSHFQGLVRRAYSFDLKLRYPPYKGKMRRLRKYL